MKEFVLLQGEEPEVEVERGRHGTERSDYAGSNRAGGPLAKDWHVGICGVKFSVEELIGPLYLIWNSKKKDAVLFPCPGLL